MTNSKKIIKLVAVSLSAIIVVCLMAIASQIIMPSNNTALAANTTSSGVKFTAMEGYCSGDGGQGYARLIDGVKTTDDSAKWCTNMATTPYIIFQAEVPIMVQSYVLVTGNDTASHEDRNPISWTLEGAINYNWSETSWTTITSETNNTTLEKTSNTAYSFSINAGSNNSGDIDIIKTTYFKYFRFKVTARKGGGTGDMQLNELELVYTGAKQSITSVSAVSGLQSKDSEGYAKLVDNNVGTKWCYTSMSSNDPYVVVKTSAPIKLNGYILTTGNDTNGHSDRNPKNWVLYGSNSSDAATSTDASIWSVVHNVTNSTTMGAKNYTPYYFSASTSTYFQYFKLLITDAQGTSDMQLSELTFDYTVQPGDVTFTATSGSPGASSGEDYTKAIDGNTDTKWCVSASTCDVYFQASKSIIVTGYILTTGSDTETQSGRNPKTWYLKGSNDNSTWTTIHTVTDDTTLEAKNKTPYTFTVDNTSAYKYYHFDVDANQGAGNTQLNEIELVYVQEGTVEYEAVAGSQNLKDSEGYQELVDGTTTTKWCEQISKSPYIIIDVSRRILVKGYSFTTANDTESQSGRNPTNWVLYGSNSTNAPASTTFTDTSVWTAIHDVSKNTSMGAVKYKEYYFTTANNANYYRYYALQISAVQGDDSGVDLVQISELDLAYSDCQHTSFGSWVNEVAATCTATGVKGHKDCSICGAHFDTNNNEIEDLTIAATGHSGGTATCSQKAVCSTCGTAYGELNTSNHTYGTWIQEVQPTCSSTGTKGHYKCSCGKYFDGSYNELTVLTIAADANAHSFGELIAEVPATCTATGTKQYKDCTLCKKHFDANGVQLTDLNIEKNSSNHIGTLGEYQKSQTEHWRIYDCCKVEVRASHTWSSGACSECGYQCDHIYENNGQCSNCGIQAEAKVDYADQPSDFLLKLTTDYLGDKLEKATTLTLLSNVTLGESINIGNDKTIECSLDELYKSSELLTFDTNGKTLTLENNDHYVNLNNVRVVGEGTINRIQINAENRAVLENVNSTNVLANYYSQLYIANGKYTMVQCYSNANGGFKIAGGELTNFTVRDTSGNKSHVDQVVVGGAIGTLSIITDARVDIMGGAIGKLDIQVTELRLKEKNIQLYGGTIDSFGWKEGLPKDYSMLLASEYFYRAKGASEGYIKLVDMTETTSVTVVKCEHHDWSQKDGKCTICGYECTHNWENNSDGKGECTTCGKTHEHTGGTATCTEQAVCEYCGLKYGTALGHSYGEVAYTWADGNSECTATRTCANDTSHVETETVTTTYKVTQNQSCTTDELTTYTATFTNTAFTVQTKVDVVTKNKTGHNYGEVTYTWAEDNSECTATRTCSNDTSHVETETVTTTYKVTQNQSCTTDELTTYTATFTNTAFAEQTKENVETKAKLGHSYGEVTYTWAEDNSECTATRTCSNDTSHVETETVKATADVTQSQSCTTDELTTYTATFTNTAFAEQTKENVETKVKLGHSYGEVTYTWAEDNSECTATRTCSNDTSHVETETVKATADVTQSQSCTTDELTTYTATFTNIAFAEQTKENVETKVKLGHSYGEVTYTWAEDNSECTATRTCSNDTSHVETETVTTTYKVTQNQSCETNELTTYTATFANTAFTVQTKADVVTKNKTGHSYGDWITEISAKCEETGTKGHYQCSVCKKNFDVDKKELTDLVIPATGHNYGKWIKETPATCVAKGENAHYHCDACGKDFDADKNVIESLVIEINPNNHAEGCTLSGWKSGGISSNTHWKVYSLCGAKAEEGEHTGGTATCKSKAVCEKCNNEYGEINSNNHSMTPIEEVSANCQSEGTKAHYKCENCSELFIKDGDTYKTVEEKDLVISKDYNVHTGVKVWDKTSEGHIEKWNCCNLTIGSREKHVYEEGTGKCETCDYECKHNGGTATCTEKATCSVCGLKYGETAPENHTYGTLIPEVPATCTNSGVMAHYECACGKLFNEGKNEVTDLTIEALGHDEESHDAKPATCTEKGWNAYVTCKRCTYTTYSEIPALGHDEVNHDGQDATCTEKGWEAYVTCSRCSYTTYKEITALGHDEISHDGQDATCTEAGWKAYVTCSRCEYSTYEKIDPLGHSGGQATCTVKAICSVCGVEYGEPLGHDIESHTALAPTCTEAGHEAYETCSRCDYSTYVVTPALGHKGGEATCTQKAKCSVCGDEYGELNPENHTGEPEWVRTEKTHYSRYNCCQAVKETEADHEWANGACSVCQYECVHSYWTNSTCNNCGLECTSHVGGVATCVKLAECEICGAEYGELDSDNHEGTPVWVKSDVTHMRRYNCCGHVVVEKEAHEWTSDGVCAECGYVCGHASWTDDVCDTCGYICPHDSWTNGVCDLCHHACEHVGGVATCNRRATCDVCGSLYGDINPDNHGDFRFVEYLAPTASEYGNIEHYRCFECDCYWIEEIRDTEVTAEEVLIAKLPPEIIEGADGSYALKSKVGLGVTSNASREDFITVLVNGEEVDSSYYTLGDDELSVELSPEFLNTLKRGKHKLIVRSESGDAFTSFRVLRFKMPVWGWVIVGILLAIIMASVIVSVLKKAGVILPD